jgi:predicted permease
MNALLQDIRYALRVLAKSPGFTAVAVLTLALGIGANTVVFSVVNALTLRDLPFQEPRQLAIVWDSNPRAGINETAVTGPNFLDWRQQNRVFQEMGAMTVGQRGTLLGEGGATSLGVLSITPGGLRLLGIQPTLGRVFAPEEEQSGKDQVMVLSHSLWKKRFHESRDIIGKPVLLDDRSRTVIGVLPPFMGFLDKLGEAYVPLTTETLRQDRGSHLYIALARLKREVSLEQAQADMRTIAARLEHQYPDKIKDWGVRVDRMPDVFAFFTRPVSMGLEVVALFVLMIICVNAANLLMGRATRRNKEIAVRLALGSSRLRLVRQLLTESVLLAVIGAAVGFLLSHAGIDLINRLLDARGYHPWNEIRLDLTVFAFTMGLAVLAGCGFGLLPAFYASRFAPQGALKESSQAVTPGRATRKLLDGLTVAQMALALVLLIGAGLLLRNLASLQHIDPGFAPDHVLCAGVTLPEARYSEGKPRAQFYESALQRLRELPQVRDVAVTDGVPMSGHDSSWGVRIEGREDASDTDRNGTQFRRISEGYFRTLRIPLTRGRFFTSQDGEDSQPVVILNQSMARHYFGEGDPIGARLTISDDGRNPRTVVGVVSDERNHGLSSEPVSMVYVPYRQGNWSTDRHHPFSFLIRTHADPLAQLQAVRSQINRLDTQLALANISSLEQLTHDSISKECIGTWLLGTFAMVALSLSILGVYGVMSGAVHARTRELGIRMALGARPGGMIWLLFKRGLILAGMGCVLGVALAFGLTRFLSFLLHGVSPLDAPAFAGALTFLAMTTLLACWFPARRAAKVDPVVALRCE